MGPTRIRTPSEEGNGPPCKAQRSEDAVDIKGVMAEYRDLAAWYDEELLATDPAMHQAGDDCDSDLDSQTQNGLGLSCAFDGDDDDDDMGADDPTLREAIREGNRKLAEARASFQPLRPTK